MKNANETEVKIPLSDRAAVERRIAQAGFQVSTPREFEANDIYDTEDQSLRQKEMILRLRQSGENAVITWKGPGVPGPHKSRPELETSIGSLDIIERIFEQLGYTRAFRYEKFRTEYSDWEGTGVVTVDETPIGDFMEIEGPAKWIDTTAGQLGFSQKDYRLESYGKLYLNYCKENGLEPGNMVFESH